MDGFRDVRSDNFSIQLTAGREYAVAGNCDDDWTDVALGPYGPGGNAVAWDRRADDEPLVLVTHQIGLVRPARDDGRLRGGTCAYTVGVSSR